MNRTEPNEGTRILLVEDDRTVERRRSGVAREYGLGYEVRVVSSGARRWTTSWHGGVSMSEAAIRYPTWCCST